LGVSATATASPGRAFPVVGDVPSYHRWPRSLAFLLRWLFAINGLIYLLHGLLRAIPARSGRDALRPSQYRRSIRSSKLKHARGEGPALQLLQKLTI